MEVLGRNTLEGYSTLHAPAYNGGGGYGQQYTAPGGVDLADRLPRLGGRVGQPRHHVPRRRHDGLRAPARRPSRRPAARGSSTTRSTSSSTSPSAATSRARSTRTTPFPPGCSSTTSASTSRRHPMHRARTPLRARQLSPPRCSRSLGGYLVSAAGRRRRRPPDLAGPAGHRVLHRERRHARPPTRSTATTAPAGPAPSPTRSGSASTSAPRPPSAGSSCAGRARTRAPSRSRPPPTATPGRPSTPPPTAPAASRTSPSPAAAATCA